MESVEFTLLYFTLYLQSTQAENELGELDGSGPH